MAGTISRNSAKWAGRKLLWGAAVNDGGNPPDTGGKSRLLTLDSLDGRTAAAKLARGLIGAIESDLGGADALSAGERQLVQRAAILGAVAEDSEARWMAGEPIDSAAYLATINAQRRVLATLGLGRRSRDITTLAQYLAKKNETTDDSDDVA